MLPIFNTRLSNTIDGCWHFDHWLRSEDHKDHSGSDPLINVQAWQSQLWSLEIRTIFFTGVGWWEASLQKPDLETLVSGSRSLTTDPWHFKLNNIDHLDEKLSVGVSITQLHWSHVFTFLLNGYRRRCFFKAGWSRSNCLRANAWDASCVSNALDTLASSRHLPTHWPRRIALHIAHIIQIVRFAYCTFDNCTLHTRHCKHWAHRNFLCCVAQWCPE